MFISFFNPWCERKLRFRLHNAALYCKCSGPQLAGGSDIPTHVGILSSHWASQTPWPVSFPSAGKRPSELKNVRNMLGGNCLKYTTLDQEMWLISQKSGKTLEIGSFWYYLQGVRHHRWGFRRISSNNRFSFSAKKGAKCEMCFASYS